MTPAPGENKVKERPSVLTGPMEGTFPTSYALAPQSNPSFSLLKGGNGCTSNAIHLCANQWLKSRSHHLRDDPLSFPKTFHFKINCIFHQETLCCFLSLPFMWPSFIIKQATSFVAPLIFRHQCTGSNNIAHAALDCNAHLLLWSGSLILLARD